MILLTVGTQLPFDRLIEAVDKIAPRIKEPVFAQTGGGNYIPENMDWAERVSPADFSKMVMRSSRIVSHAGIGSVLMARKFGKPIVLYPRRAALGEHRNDHQMATIGALRGRPGVHIAETDEELAVLLQADLGVPMMDAPSQSREQLFQTIMNFIDPGAPPPQRAATGRTGQ